MKKKLLFLSLIVTTAVSAQNRQMARGVPAVKATVKNAVYSEVVRATSLPQTIAPNARGGNGGNQTSAITEVTIGKSGNVLGPAFGPKANLYYDANLNTIAFMHRSDDLVSGWPTNGFYLYDVSTDGGATWTVDHPVAGDTSNITRGRYPQGVIYNPSGNTDPNNARVNIVGPTNDGGTGFCNTSWNGLQNGTGQVGQTGYSWEWIQCAPTGLNSLIPSGAWLVKNTGVVYYVVSGYDGAAYNDTIILARGIFNAAENDFDFEFQKLFIPMCNDVTGAKMYVDVNTAWSEDGSIGYITLLGNDWACTVQQDDSTYGLIVYKTTDGGQNWTELGRPWLSLLDPVLANGNFFCTTAFEHDVTIDKNNNIHVAVAAGAFAGGGSIGTTHGQWAIMDITTPDGGAHWNAYVLGYPQTFRGTFGDGSTLNPTVPEDSRPQCSRSWDGSKVFFTWFDTDTLTYGTTENIFPDMHSIGYDVDANMWTSRVNHTGGTGTSADGGSLWGNVGTYTINDGTDECIPMVGGVMDNPPISTGTTLHYYYLDGACMSNYGFNNTVIPITIFIGTEEGLTANSFQVSANYPNPYTGKTSVDVTLPKAADVTMEISNAIGQVISTSTWQNLHQGLNTLTLDGSSLSKGLYFYTVKSGADKVTRTMSVE